MFRNSLRHCRPRTLALLLSLAGLAASAPALPAQTAAATPNPAIFGRPSLPVVYTGNFRHYDPSDVMAHGSIVLSFSPAGSVTGTLVWHGTTTSVPLKGRLDVVTGAGHFTPRDADGRKLADAMRIPCLVNPSGLTLSGGGMADNGESTSFFLTRRSGSAGTEDSAGGAVLSLGSASSATLSYAAGTLVTGSAGDGASSTAVGFVPNLGVVSSGATTTLGGATLTVGNNLTTTALGGFASLVFNGSGVPPAVVDGNLTYQATVLLYGPLTTTTDATGATTYSGTNVGGSTSTVVVEVAAASTGG